MHTETPGEYVWNNCEKSEELGGVAFFVLGLLSHLTISYSNT